MDLTEMGEMKEQVKNKFTAYLVEVGNRRAKRRESNPREQQRQAGLKVLRQAHKRKLEEFKEVQMWEDLSDQ